MKRIFLFCLFQFFILSSCDQEENKKTVQDNEQKSLPSPKPNPTNVSEKKDDVQANAIKVVQLFFDMSAQQTGSKMDVSENVTSIQTVYSKTISSSNGNYIVKLTVNPQKASHGLLKENMTFLPCFKIRGGQMDYMQRQGIFAFEPLDAQSTAQEEKIRTEACYEYFNEKS